MNNFVPLLRKVIHESKTLKGMMLILDDINGLAANEDFANWLKSIVDEIATGRNPLPLTIILVGYHERRDQLIKNQPSLNRVFDLINIKPFTQDETREFYRQAFQKVNTGISEEALKYLVLISGGFPVFLHELGNAVFQTDTDNYIDIKDALSGIVRGIKVIGEKHIEPMVLSTIRSEKYKKILRTIGGMNNRRFSRDDLIEKLREVELKVFDNFISKMRKLGVFKTARDSEKGYYEFTSELYSFYFWMYAEAMI